MHGNSHKHQKQTKNDLKALKDIIFNTHLERKILSSQFKGMHLQDPKCQERKKIKKKVEILLSI